MTPPAAERLLEFWFGPLDVKGLPELVRRRRWFQPPAGFDAELRQRFGALVEAALAGSLDAWTLDPRGRLALVLLLDQLTRNLFRDTPEAFAGDALALEHALEAIDSGEASGHAPVERTFLYMPLMHAEDLALQDRCIELFETLVASAEGSARELFQGNLEFAKRHREPIARFGRFPSRNVALGRKSLPEEQAWLAAHPGGF